MNEAMDLRIYVEEEANVVRPWRRSADLHSFESNFPGVHSRILRTAKFERDAIDIDRNLPYSAGH